MYVYLNSFVWIELFSNDLFALLSFLAFISVCSGYISYLSHMNIRKKLVFFESVILLEIHHVLIRVFAAVCRVLLAAGERRRKFYCTVLCPGFIGMLTLYICISKLHTVTIFNYIYTHFLGPAEQWAPSHRTKYIRFLSHIYNRLTGLHIFIPDSLCCLSHLLVQQHSFVFCVRILFFSHTHTQTHHIIPYYYSSYYHQSLDRSCFDMTIFWQNSCK